MIARRRFQMMEPPRASSGSAPTLHSLAAKNRTPLALGNSGPVGRVPPCRSRSPPRLGGQLPEVEGQQRSQKRRWASGGHRQPRQTNLQPESTTERSQL